MGASMRLTVKRASKELLLRLLGGSIHLIAFEMEDREYGEKRGAKFER